MELLHKTDQNTSAPSKMSIADGILNEGSARLIPEGRGMLSMFIKEDGKTLVT